MRVRRLSRRGNHSPRSTTLCDPQFRGHSLPAKSVDSSVFASLFNSSLVSTCECSSPLDHQTRQIASAWSKTPNSVHLPPAGRRQRGTGSSARGASVAGIPSRDNFDTNKPKRESSSHHLHPTRLSPEPRQVEDRAAVQAPSCPDKASGKGRKQSRNALCHSLVADIGRPVSGPESSVKSRRRLTTLVRTTPSPLSRHPCVL